MRKKTLIFAFILVIFFAWVVKYAKAQYGGGGAYGGRGEYYEKLSAEIERLKVKVTTSSSDFVIPIKVYNWDNLTEAYDQMIYTNPIFGEKSILITNDVENKLVIEGEHTLLYVDNDDILDEQDEPLFHFCQEPKSVEVYFKYSEDSKGGGFIALWTDAFLGDKVGWYVSYAKIDVIWQFIGKFITITTVENTWCIFTDGRHCENDIFIFGDEVPLPNQLNQIVITFDTKDNWIYYLNGEYIKKGHFPTPIFAGRTQPLDPVGLVIRPFVGGIKEVNVYRGILSSEVIKQHYEDVI